MTVRHRIRRLAGLVALAVAVAACGSADLAREDVDDVVVGAFASADVEVTDVEVAEAPVDGAWPVTAKLPQREIELAVDASSGRVVRIDFGVDAAPLTQEQLEDIAAHADNPAADRARRNRLVLLFVALFGLMAGGLAVARQLRLREEAALNAAE